LGEELLRGRSLGLSLGFELGLSWVDGEKDRVLISELGRYLLDGLLRQIFVGLSDVYGPMGISAIFTETAHFFVLIELAFLSFVVVVGDVE
jgi:hypothetical protein